MVTRREMIGGAGGLLLLHARAAAQSPAGRTRQVFNHALPRVTLDDWSVTAVEVSYPPGEASPPHHHPGITLAYVLEGSIRSKVGDAPERTYAAGEMFIENPGELHAVSRNASETSPARLLALLLAPKGQALTTPAQK